MAPAEGDAFQFEVQLTITWRAEGVTRAQLKALADSQQSRIYRHVRHRINELSRTVPPHRALELEGRLNEQFGRSWAAEDGVLVRWRAKARVLPEARVLEKLRPYWERRIEMDSDHELRLRQVELVEKLTRRWSELLAQLHQQPFTVEGAKLAEQEFAKIMEDLKKEEKDLRDNLQSLLEGAATSHSTLGLFEYAETYDRLINEYRQRIDLLAGSESPRQESATGNGRSG